MALDLGNPVRNIAGNPHYGRMPRAAKALNVLIDAMAAFPGTCWAPVEKVVDGKAVEWALMLNQCPGACGHVWKLTMQDENICKWLVNAINQRRAETTKTKAEPYSRGCEARSIPGATCQSPNCDC